MLKAAMDSPLESPINDNQAIDFTSRIDAVVQKSTQLYHRLLGPTVLDALSHFPTNIVQKMHCLTLSPDFLGQHVTMIVEPIEHIPSQKRGGPYRILCHVKPSNDPIELIFFYKRMSTKFLTFAFAVGQTKHITGKLEKIGDHYRMTHPMTMNRSSLIGQQKNPATTTLSSTITDASAHENDKDIVYPQIAGLVSADIHRVINGLIKKLQKPLEWHDERYGYPSLLEACHTIHNPKTLAEVNRQDNLSYQRLLHDELLAQQMALMITRSQTKSLKGIEIHPNTDLFHHLKQRLPFTLTQGQEEALRTISTDMASGEPMLRLIQGDVGCGKTVVAALAMADVIDQRRQDGSSKGFQAAVLAPTDILSTQHYVTFSKLFEGTDYRIALLTGKVIGKKRKDILERLERGEIHILIGTHALIQDHVAFQKLAMVVVDEQHRFGVNQRSKLTEKGTIPHLLSMTATPIPRTLQMALCGDLDVTSILEKPVGRKDIKTSLHSIERVNDIVEHLQKIITPTNKAYWVCPLIEESENLDYTAVTERFAHLQIHFGKRVGLMHGKMRAVEKDAVMTAFKSGEIDLLVSTTVIEVGVDVKTANIMIIEHAERFGLAQLHQLRGRVGRSNQQARCLLLYDKLSSIVQERLKAMRDSNDGFYLAEMDLKIRGGGDVLGLAQSGQKPFRFYKGNNSQLLHRLLRCANIDATKLMEADPTLSSPRGQAIRDLLRIFQKDNSLSILRSG